MDIKLKNNNNDYNNSEINKEKNKKANRSNGIIATLIALTLIIAAALGMINSYGFVNKMSEKLKENYFDQYSFANVLAESSYSSYYNALKVNNDKLIEPADVLLDITSNVVTREDGSYVDEYIYDIRNNFNNYIYQGNNANGENLNYYALDTLNKKVNSNFKEDIKVANDNIDIASINADNYQFYAKINFDNNGDITISDVFGANKDILQSNLERKLKNIINHYNYSYHGENQYYNFSIKPIKNMSFVYAVPKSLTSYGGIKYGIQNSTYYGYEVGGLSVALIIAGLLALTTVIFPIRKAKEMALFRSLSKIPFEIWVVAISLVITVLAIGSGAIIREMYIGELKAVLKQVIENPTILIWIGNFLIWFICYGAVFFFVLIIKYIFNLGFIEYLKRRTIVGSIIMFFVKYIKKTLNSVTNVNLNEKNNKLILKIVIINGLILAGITSIWFFGIPVVIIYSFIIFFVIKRYVEKISGKYNILKKATNKIAEGNLDVGIEEDLWVFEPFKDDLERIQSGFKKAVDEEVKSQKMKTDLISNVSHDLKTPLTAIITYTDLLKDEKLSEEKRNQYLDILDKKAQRLQTLIEDLFEMSKASSGNITLNIENVDVVSLMKQTILELDDKIQEAQLVVKSNLPENKVILPLDSQRTFRVFENLVINMTKYAMRGTRVYIDIIENEESVNIILKNMAAEEINFNVDTIADRFVRGDKSRNTEGSGLGLAIAKSFVELQNGEFKISVDGDLFKVSISFNKLK